MLPNAFNEWTVALSEALFIIQDNYRYWNFYISWFINILSGELLSAGSSAALISSSASTRIKIKPDQRYDALIALNNSAEVWLPANTRKKWPAKVVFVDPAGNAEQGSISAELSIDQNVPELYPGRLVSVLVLGSPVVQGILIPESYLCVYEGQTGVWIARNKHCYFSDLELGIRTPEGIEVLKGLQKGDLVLKPDTFKEGQRVSPHIKEFDNNAK